MTETTTPVAPVDGYARALLAVGASEGSGVADEIYAAAKALDGNAELIDVLSDTRIPSDRKQGIVDDLLGARASQVAVAAVNFLVAAGQGRHLGDIASRLAELAAEAEGEVVAEVRAAVELDAGQVERLKEALSEITGRRVKVQVIVDPAVIGGIVTKVGDTVLDGSVHHRITELKEQWG